jgi:hypothetical protein
MWSGDFGASSFGWAGAGREGSHDRLGFVSFKLAFRGPDGCGQTWEQRSEREWLRDMIVLCNKLDWDITAHICPSARRLRPLNRFVFALVRALEPVEYCMIVCAAL